MTMPEDLAALAAAETKASQAFSFDLEKFQGDLTGDSVAVLIRAHLYVEHVLIQTLLDHFVVTDVLDVRRLNFLAKLNLCVALGLLPRTWHKSVSMINELRNRVAHRLDYAIPDDWQVKFWGSFPDFLKAALQETKKGAEVRRAYMFMGLIVWLDIARQKTQANRIGEKYGREYLARALKNAKEQHPDLFSESE